MTAAGRTGEERRKFEERNPGLTYLTVSERDELDRTPPHAQTSPGTAFSLAQHDVDCELTPKHFFSESETEGQETHQSIRLFDADNQVPTN